MNQQAKLIEPQSALEVLQTSNLPELFTKGGLEPLLKQIEMEVHTHEPDIKTAKGRKAIASLANNVAKSKVLIDNAGKSLGEDMRAKINAINESRRNARERLVDLKAVARKPLDDWEAIEAEKAAAELLAARLELDHENALIEHDLYLRQAAIEAKEREIAEAEAKRLEAEQIEADRKAKEQAEKDRLAREAKIREDAIKQAEIDRKEAERIAAQEAEDAAQRLKDAEAQAERDKVEAVAEARRQEQQAARDQELKRQADEDRKRRDEIAKADDLKHRQKIHDNAAKDLDKYGIKDAAKIVDLIAAGKIRNVSIRYS